MTGPALDGVLEAALYAEDLDAAERFYGGTLGLSVIVRVEGRHVFFRCGATILLVFDPRVTAIPPAKGALPVPPHGAHGPGHVCFTAADGTLQAWSDALSGAGVAIESVVDWPHGPRSIYVRDPAGNSVEFAERALWSGMP